MAVCIIYISGVYACVCLCVFVCVSVYGGGGGGGKKDLYHPYLPSRGNIVPFVPKIYGKPCTWW